MKQSPLEIIPAIDILYGKCVRLTRGQYDQVEEFSDKPQEIAKKWQDLGAKRLHIVDLNGAKEGYPVNRKIISAIVRTTNVKIQVGGGIRTLETIKDYLNEGVHYVILGTKAFQDLSFLRGAVDLYNEKIILGLDLKNKRVALSGWQESIDIDICSLKEYLSKVRQIVYTDIVKDGTLSGLNLNSIEEIANIFESRIIISGGISSIDDILTLIALKKEKYPNISGVILGKSLYKGTIDLRAAIECVGKEFK